MKSIAMSHRRHLRPTLRHLPPALFALLLAALALSALLVVLWRWALQGGGG